MLMPYKLPFPVQNHLALAVQVFKVRLFYKVTCILNDIIVFQDRSQMYYIFSVYYTGHKVLTLFIDRHVYLSALTD